MTDRELLERCQKSLHRMVARYVPVNTGDRLLLKALNQHLEQEMTFDEWRARYDTMSFQQHAAANNEWGVEYPAQASWKLQPVLDALADARSVVEVGGWDGGLAAKALPLLPNVERWVNYEMCQPAVDRTVCHDDRYRPVLLEDWPWNTDLEAADALVMSHVVEHMRFHQVFELTRLFDRYRTVHMQAPLDLERIDWTGYHGSHVLEVGWLGVEALMRPWTVSGWGAAFRTWVAPTEDWPDSDA